MVFPLKKTPGIPVAYKNQHIIVLKDSTLRDGNRASTSHGGSVTCECGLEMEYTLLATSTCLTSATFDM